MGRRSRAMGQTKGFRLPRPFSVRLGLCILRATAVRAAQTNDWLLTRGVGVVRTLLQVGILFPALSTFCRVTSLGRESLQHLDGPAVFVANHVSELDAVVMARALPSSFRRRAVVVAARDSVFSPRIKAFAAQVAVCAVPISRKGGAHADVENLKRLLKRDWSVIMFPEGRVTVTGAIARFRKGAAMIAMDVGVPVVPVYVDGMYRVMRTYRRVPYPGLVTVMFGRPLWADGDEDYGRFTARIERTLRELAGPKGLVVDPPSEGARPVGLSYSSPALR